MIGLDFGSTTSIAMVAVVAVGSFPLFSPFLDMKTSRSRNSRPNSHKLTEYDRPITPENP